MNLYIMSRGRAGKTITQKSISEYWRPNVVFIVPNNEVEAYGKALGHKFRIWPAAEHITNYSQKFQWIMDGLPLRGVAQDPLSKAVILDDDLVFASRSDPERPNSLITITDPERTTGMFLQIGQLLEKFPLVSVHPRAMGNMAPERYDVNNRIICIQAIDRELVHGIRVDQHPILADVILNATLLSHGFSNARVTTYFQNWGPVNAAGGCSDYRTADMQRAAVEYVCNRWPSCFSIRTPKKLAPNMGTEYIGQWKKLYELGKEWRENRGPCPDREGAGTVPALGLGAV